MILVINNYQNKIYLRTKNYRHRHILTHITNNLNLPTYYSDNYRKYTNIVKLILDHRLKAATKQSKLS